jgi:hypothetical protein
MREPGDEVEEVDWMQGLSSRLSAYSLAGDDDERGDENGSGPGPDDADSA